jgi:hypothetical protein
MDYGDADNAKGYYILDLNTLVYNFFENNISPKYVKVNLSELVKNESINDTIREQFRGNFIKLYIDRNISHEDMIFLTNILNQLQPLSLNIEYDINYNVITSSNIEADFSGIDIEQAIIEFVNLLDIDDKKEIVNITTALYNKCKA